MVRLCSLTTVLAFYGAAAISPKHSWDYLGNMTFFHACNESGLYSEDALDVIAKFPLVTVEKGQGFNDGTGRKAEEKIVEQLQAVKARDSSIATVFYMNSVLDWYFYGMHDEYVQHPEWWLRNSKTDEPVYESGDKTFNPPKEGILIFDHAKEAVQGFWRATCRKAVQSGVVDGCFSDSSQPGTHKTETQLNKTDNAAFEAGKVKTMTAVTADFNGTAGAPYTGSTGVLIGKKSDQEGINAYQIEFFEPTKDAIEELRAGAQKGWLVQAHVGVNNVVTTCGCECMNDTVAAFLVGAGDYSFFGSGKWITASLDEVQRQWCAPLFERPLGQPLADAKLSNGRYVRHFASGTWVEFDTETNKGSIHWADAPSMALI